ncbi:MAG: hypothetical protein WCB27_16490 [Thermoguttaceae bacterium]
MISKVVLRAAIVVVIDVCFVSVHALSGEPSKKSAIVLEKAIDALANHNPPPRILDLHDKSVPIFPAKYDWREDSRVRTAIRDLQRETSPEMWEHMVAHSRDQRYCITCNDPQDFATNFSVGDICGWVAKNRIYSVLQKNRLRLPPPSPMGKDLLDWRRSHAKSSYVELQIEVCSDAIRRLGDPAAENSIVKYLRSMGLTEEVVQTTKTEMTKEIGECCTKLRAEIKKLRATKMGAFDAPLFPEGWGGRTYFSAQRADEIRKRSTGLKKSLSRNRNTVPFPVILSWCGA